MPRTLPAKRSVGDLVEAEPELPGKGVGHI